MTKRSRVSVAVADVLAAVGGGAVLALGLAGHVTVDCQAAGALRGGHLCAFTNNGTVLPGKVCARIIVTKTKTLPYNADPDPEFMQKQYGAERPVGHRLESLPVCSGLVWGGSTVTLPVMFEQN